MIAVDELVHNKGAKALENPNPCKDLKVHLSICLELQKLVDRILHIILATESARPNCTLAIKALCSLHLHLNKANSIIKHSSECSKLYLAMTSHRILSRCEKIRNAFELYLTQIQSAVPLSLAAEISGILHDLKDTEFSPEIEEVEARKAILALYEKDFNDSASSMENAELEAIQIATSRLKINSTFSLIVEKASLRKQLDQVINNDTNQKEKQLLQYLLYLLMRYGKFIHQIGSNSLDHDLVVDKEHSHQVMESIDNVVRDFEVLST
ncbi:U-box domain-containing protein 6-like [Arachis stenosperma]|uniref:U-box domain-containing protein 6-like n=1 Tax=Arachis stenosperma TaxID=217475 RepID=UPI0025AC437D|nr:U-box domain-containing protein 6-like [Arachis stenosperma]